MKYRKTVKYTVNLTPKGQSFKERVLKSKRFVNDYVDTIPTKYPVRIKHCTDGRDLRDVFIARANIGTIARPGRELLSAYAVVEYIDRVPYVVIVCDEVFTKDVPDPVEKPKPKSLYGRFIEWMQKDE